MRKWRNISAVLFTFLLIIGNIPGYTYPVCAGDSFAPETSDASADNSVFISEVHSDEISVVDVTGFTQIDIPDDKVPVSYDDLEPITGEFEKYDGTLEEYLSEHAGEMDNPVVQTWGENDAEDEYKAVPLRMSSGTGTITLTSGGNDYGYRQLSEGGKKLYNEIKAKLEELVNSEGFGTENYTDETRCITAGIALEGAKISEQECNNAFLAFYYDNPQYYFLKGHFGVIIAGDTVTALLSIDEEYLAAATRTAANTAILTTATSWIADITSRGFYNSTLPKADRDYMTAVAVHDLITERISYSYESPGQPEGAKWAHSIAGVFTKQGAVCEAYARTYYYMLNLLGVDSIYVVGTADGDGHAWNVLGIDGRYYCVDITWNDLNDTSGMTGPESSYYYFCLPSSVFGGSHAADTPKGKGFEWLYELPRLENNADFFYYSYVNAFFTKEFSDDAEVEAAVDVALASQLGEYLQILCNNSGNAVHDFIQSAEQKGATFFGGHYRYDSYRMDYAMHKVSSSVPITDLSISTEGAPETELEDSIVFTASCTPSNTDECVIWSVRVKGAEADISASNIVSWKAEGNKLTVTGISDGFVTVSARTAINCCADSIDLKVGSGQWIPKSLIYKNGDKDHKSYTVMPERVSATKWYDAKGRTKSGKLVYVSRNDLNGIEFDTAKHTVITKSDKTVVSVSSKGVVSAKGPGTAYVYVIDTGTMDYEVFTVYVEAAPTKLTASAVAGSLEKEDVIKTTALPVGTTGIIHIVPTLKNMAVSDSCTYKAELAKSEYDSYLSIMQPVKGADGDISIRVTALSNDVTKAKPATAKVVVTNIESGKKVTVSIIVYNPVNTVLANVISGTDLDTKKDTVKLGLTINTPQGSSVKTTAKLKVYVGQTSVTLDGRKVIADRGATVGAKLDKNYSEITLTAKKDAGVPAVISILATESAVKDYKLYRIASVDAEGHVMIEAE